MSSSEGTPLLRNAGVGGDAEEELRRTSAGEGDDGSAVSRRRGRRPGGKAIAGALMFALAAAGLVAIFNAMQDATLEASGEITALDVVTNGHVSVSVPSGLQHGSKHGGTAGMLAIGNPRETHGNKDVAGPAVSVTTGKSDPTRVSGEGSIDHGVSEDVGRARQAPWSTSRDRGVTAGSTPSGVPSASLEESEGTGMPSKTTATASAHGSSKPNVFFIMIDDMGWNDIGYQSTDLYELTPNLDRLASNGIKVRQ